MSATRTDSATRIDNAAAERRADAGARLIYYVRHGLTDWNVEGRLQGQRDTALNARGRAQAVRSGEILHELLARDRRSASEFDFVASPLMRARETMELLRAGLGLDRAGYRTAQALAEISFGDWEGMTLAEIEAIAPNAIAARERAKWTFRPPGGESYVDVTARVGAWHATLTGDAVVVAHGGTARALIAHLRIAEPESAVHQDIDQGVVYVMGDGQLTRYG